MSSSWLPRPVAGAARKAFRPLLAVYYRLLYGRRFPLSEVLGRWVAAGERWVGRGDVPLTREDWEAQYRGGDWDFLEDAGELARYALIAAWLHRLCPGGSVLDVGCGEGVLLDHLSPFGPRRYVGIDLSEAAIEKGRERSGETVELLVADAETYQPAERFDAVVLNECLYYFHDPIGEARKYRDCLAEGGVLVVSMFRSWRTDAILRRLEAAWPAVASTRVSNPAGTWTLAVFRR